MNCECHDSRSKKVTLKGASSSSPDQTSSNPLTTSNLPTSHKQPDMITTKSKQLASSSSFGYNIVEQLKLTTTQISILELLKISYAHTQILDKALLATNVPKDLGQFQSMVDHSTSPHYLSFSEEDENSLSST